MIGLQHVISFRGKYFLGTFEQRKLVFRVRVEINIGHNRETNFCES